MSQFRGILGPTWGGGPLTVRQLLRNVGVQTHHTIAHAHAIQRHQVARPAAHATSAHRAALTGVRGGTFHFTASGKRDYSKR